MKPFIERLPLKEGESFAARVHTTPSFEVPWHQHEETELIYFIEGEGICRAGNYIGPFKKGDLFYIGGKLPHQFDKSDPSAIISAAVIHFREDVWGEAFVQLPENRMLRDLFTMGKSGLKVDGNTTQRIVKLILSLSAGTGNRLLSLLECLHAIGSTHQHTHLSAGVQPEYYNWRDQERIDKVYRFTMASFREKVQLSDVAAISGMTVPAFCNYFKKRTRKTYIDFLNEVRIGYAGQLLLETECAVTDACHASGFNNLAHFNRQFRKLKGVTPSEYRHLYEEKDNFSSMETDLGVRILEGA